MVYYTDKIKQKRTSLSIKSFNPTRRHIIVTLPSLLFYLSLCGLQRGERSSKDLHAIERQTDKRMKERREERKDCRQKRVDVVQEMAFTP